MAREGYEYDLATNSAPLLIGEVSNESEREVVSRSAPVALRCGAGRWQTKSLFVFDPQEKGLIRRTYTVWNSCTVHDLDFSWIPDNVDVDTPGRITGAGRLIWRPRGKPAYDRGSIHAEYVGEMKDGKPDGVGVYFDRLGYQYDGNWSEGYFEGNGRFQLSNGDEYVGSFRMGRAHGTGRYFQSDGEIYSGRFEDGLRDGAAELTLPIGHIVRSQWIAGEEVGQSSGARLAQLGTPSATVDDIRLGVLIDPVPLKKGMLGYTASNTTDGLIIGPADKRLMALWKGPADIALTDDDLQSDRGGMFPLIAAELPPALLVLDVENRGTRSIEVVDANLEVTTSSPDLQPLVVIVGSNGVIPCEKSYIPSFEIRNFGWAALEQATIKFAFARPQQSDFLGLQTWSKELGLIRGSTTVDVDENLRASKVNVTKLRELAMEGEGSFTCSGKSQTECFAEVMKLDLFGDIAPSITRENANVEANLIGFLSYKWRDGEGRLNDRASQFKVRVLLATLEHAAECEGAEMEPLKTKDPLMLDPYRTGYKLPIGLRTSIAAGRTSRYSLVLRAAKSSRYEFRVVLLLADGRELRSRPINLLYFLPGRLDT